MFLTTAIEGEVVPGAKAPIHYLQDDKAKPPEPFLHPDSMGADKKHTQKVMALALDSGKLIWERVAHEGPVFDNRHKASSYASPTPVTDGALVYAYFGSEGIFAYDFDGTLAWKADLGDFKTIGMGTSTSPVLYRHLVILQCDENNGDASFIVALDKKTGKEIWRTKRDVQVSWATPVLVEAGGRTELVTSGFERIYAYDPATGKELWRTKGLESNSIHTPLVGHGLVILTAGYPAKRVIAIRPGGSGDITGTDRIAWTYDKGTAYVADADPVRGLRLFVDRLRHRHVPRREDGGGAVRGRPAARAGALHGLSGRLGRPPLLHEHRRRHLRRQGGADARDRADEHRRRTGLCVSRTRAGPHLDTGAGESLLCEGRGVKSTDYGLLATGYRRQVKPPVRRSCCVCSP